MLWEEWLFGFFLGDFLFGICLFFYKLFYVVGRELGIRRIIVFIWLGWRGSDGDGC